MSDAEIIPSETQKGGMRREFSSELINNETGLYSLDGNASHNDIKSRIQHLQSELSSTLHSLRSSSDKITKQIVSVTISNTEFLLQFSLTEVRLAHSMFFAL